MKKEILQQAIKRRAKSRLDNEVNEFFKLCYNNPFLSKMEINIDNEKRGFISTCGYSNELLYSNLGSEANISNVDRSQNTNISEIYHDLLEKYIIEEENEILDKLDNLQYLWKD